MSTDDATLPGSDAPTPPVAESPTGGDGGIQEMLEERPEILAGAAFVGGIVTAMIVRRFGR